MKIWLIFITILGAPPAWSQSEPLGRLFFTPQQRTALDHQRRQGLSTNLAQESSYTLNGEVIRSSGRNTRWVNGEAQTSSTPPKGIIGDTYHPATGERESLLGDGRILIQKASPKP